MFEIMCEFTFITELLKVDLSTVLTLFIGVLVVVIQVVSNVRIANINNALSLKNERKKQIFEDEKQAIYEFYILMNSWILYKYRQNFMEIYLLEHDDIEDVRKFVIELGNKLQVHKFMIELLNSNEAILKSTNYTYVTFMQCHDFMVKSIFEIMQLKLKQKSLYLEYGDDSNEMKEWMQNTFRITVSKIFDESEKFHNALMQEYSLFQNAVNEHLNN